MNVQTAVVRCEDVGFAGIISQLNLNINQGERVAIVGRNGAGKTTLLRLLMGSRFPDSGTLEIMGMNPALLRREKLRALKAQIGVIFQGIHLVERVSALENVVIGRLGRNHSWSTLFKSFTKIDYEIAFDSLREVGLEHKAEQRTDSLSGGEKQKIALARALAQESSLILADEPTSALDPAATKDMAQLLGRLAAKKCITLVTILHDIELIESVADRVLALESGKIILDCPTEELEKQDLLSIYEHKNSSQLSIDINQGHSSMPLNAESLTNKVG